MSDFPPDAFVSEILSLHDASDAQKAENERLTGIIVNQEDALASQAAAIARLTASLDTARAALEPFAKHAAAFEHDLHPDRHGLLGPTVAPTIIVGDFRRAAAALLHSPTAPPDEIPHPATPEPETPPSVAHSGGKRYQPPYREF
jgi:hypothetical protein